MKKILMSLALICLVLITFVSCGKAKYIGTYALNDKSFEALKETTLEMVTDIVKTTYGEEAEGFEEYLEMYAEIAFDSAMQEIGDMRITFKEDGSVELTMSGEKDSTTSLEVSDNRDCYINGSYLGNFSEDYQILTCKIEGIEFLLFKIE